MSHEIVELHDDLSASAFYSHDLAPIPAAERNWGTKDFAVFWISLSACLPTYMLASSMIDSGMDWKQAIFTILLGNLIVLFPILLNAQARIQNMALHFPSIAEARLAFGEPISLRSSALS